MVRKGHLLPSINVIYTDSKNNTYTYTTNSDNNINTNTNTTANTKILSLFYTKTDNNEIVLFVDRCDVDTTTTTTTNDNKNYYGNTFKETNNKSQFTQFSGQLQFDNDNRDITQSSSLLLLPANDYNNSHINNNFGRPNSFNNTNSSSFTQNAFEPLQYIHENNDNNNDNHDEKRRKLDDYKCNDKDNRTLGTW